MRQPVNDRDLAVAALTRRLERAREDFAALFEAEALGEAAALAELVGSGPDLEAFQRLGIFYWCRSLVLPAAENREDYEIAVRYLFAVYKEAPETVPEQLQPVFAETLAVPDSVYVAEYVAGLLENFGGSGDIAEVTDSVTLFRELLQATLEDDPGRASYLGMLGAALTRLGSQLGEVETLTEAVETLRQAVTVVSADDPAYTDHFGNLAEALQALYEHTGDVRLLAEARESLRRAVDCAGPDSVHRAGYLGTLSVVLATLADREGDAGLLDEAVEAGYEAVAAAPPGHPESGDALDKLGAVLFRLADRRGDTEPLVGAVEAWRAAVRAHAVGHPGRGGCLNNLGGGLLALAVRTGDAALMREAVDVGRQAVEALPDDDPHYGRALANLAAALVRLFDQLGDGALLVEAVGYGRLAVAAAAVGHPDRAAALDSLCALLTWLFENTGDVGALTEAVEAGRESVAATPQDRLVRAARLNNLGIALEALAEQGRDAGLFAESADCFRAAAEVPGAAVLTRIRALRKFAGVAGPASIPPAEVLAAVESAIGLLPQVSARSLARGDREHRVGRLRSLPEIAVAAALDAGDARRAVELLEATRGILVADALDARSGDLAVLRRCSPELAGEFEALRERREALDGGRGFEGDAADSSGRERREVQAGWDAVLGRIRALEGFADFLAPPDAVALGRQAEDGPIVFLVAGARRCDALILTADVEEPVRVVGLPGLTRRDADVRAAQLLALPTAASVLPQRDLVTEADEGGVDGGVEGEALDVLAWLWDVVAEPVLTALGCTGTPEVGRPWPRVWWCPVDVMAYLPIHAAGHHRDVVAPGAGGPRTVMDRVVSSYTPTVRALGSARAHPSGGAVATLITAVPDAPGANPLPGVAAEAEAVLRWVPGALRPEHPVRDEVLAALPAHPVVHFACHGLADWADPAASRLILHDHLTRPLTVADISALHLAGALAYLSACATMSSSPGLANEALHLTGAFHLAGYRNVIGTLWRVNDEAALRIATDFYDCLTDGGMRPPDASASALALHHAVRALRAEAPDAPTLWMAHTHTGV